MEALLNRQNDIINEVKKIFTNFRKDSAFRKTRDYIQLRVQALDNLWGEFLQNDSKLEEHRDDNYEYFSKNVFVEFKKYFESTRDAILTFEIAPPSSDTRFTLPVADHGKVDSKPSQRLEELLSQQRTNFRALQRLIDNFDISDITEKWEIEDELKNIQHRWHVIDELHLQIDNLLQGEDGFYEGEFRRMEITFKDTKKALNRKIFSTNHAQLSVPQIDIPVFFGNYNQWPTFCDLFTETIHSNKCLTKTQKMQHLKSKIKGEAERLIQHLNISCDNYDTAWDILVHRYNNPQVLFTKQIEVFLNQPTIHKQSSHELKKIYDTTTECVNAIHNLGIDTTTWDPLLVHLVVKKLDSDTYTDYKESRKNPRDLPSFDELMAFLENKFIALEPLHKRERETSTSNKPVQHSSYKPAYKNPHFPPRTTFQNYQTVATFTRRCPYCAFEHDLYHCKKFLNMSPEAKMRTINKLQICHNCLYQHRYKCNSTKRCKECNAAHNTILHETITSVSPNSVNSMPPIVPSPSDKATTSKSVNHVASQDEEILLTTVSLRIKTSDNSFITLRALLDQGSQISLISENAAQLLGLQRRQYHASVSGIGFGSKQGKGVVSLQCRSLHDDYTLHTQALVINQVINNLPNASFSRQTWPHLQHLKLADPEYYISKPIDILLDASVYSEIILSGLIKGPPAAPIAQQTTFGWILSGNVKTFCCNVVLTKYADLSKYWEIEDIPDDSTMSQEDIYCEELFQATTTRLEDGRYQVALPMKPDYQQNLGISKPKALAQFMQIEKRMTRDHKLHQGYHQFMTEYQELGHMQEVTSDTDAPDSQPVCYLPHHPVIKSDSTTTSLRVVFNASSKTTSGYSLNDLMYSGPNLQQDLLTLILKWRQHKYVITADIEKMFRQMMVRECDRDLQRIFWRDTSHSLLKQYRLATISYGQTAAPWLAMRVLKQIGRDHAHTYPLAASELEYSFYMDDLMSGHNSIDSLKEIQRQIVTVLKSAGMNIRKWSSNASEILCDLSTEQKDTGHFDFKDTESRKTLGLRWSPTSDTFTFKGIEYSDKKSTTKRQMLSEISKTFDPLGWVSPLTIRAKLLFQKTWTYDISWDEELPQTLQDEWLLLRVDLHNICKFTIPRHLGDTQQKCQIHGFCDASERAYACAIYIVTKNHKGEYTSKLVAAKTKVAPCNRQISLPRMELLGALLLTKLVKKVMTTIGTAHMEFFAWTDSMIVLGWIHGDKARWKPFVANRVQQIIDIIPSTSWNHVCSEENAADCATRGMTAYTLERHFLWWIGPEWLTNFDKHKFTNKTYETPSIEIKEASVHAALHQNNSLLINELLTQKSNIDKLIKTIGWMLHFISRLRKQGSRLSSLTSKEIQAAYHLVIKTIQAQEFTSDLRDLRTKGHVRSSSKIASLNPFIDHQGILRLGGRLRNSELSYSTKHPILLTSGHRFTELIIRQAHFATLHGGPKLTLAYIREKYWILSGLRCVKRELRTCVKCKRNSQTHQQPIMADLPQVRVTPSRPFTNVGVDFTGHVELKLNKGRGVRTTKGYVAVFVCMSTKAVHLELVSDMSTATFLAAFRRMCARRGTPANVYSDNGTNFVGAAKTLQKEYKEILQLIQDCSGQSLDGLDITWHFNAPAWPNAGGIWESAVKSFKHHLKRVLGEQRLTYEEFTTLLHQIEACLNSRPLCQLTENPDDIYLTPGHFLVGGSLLSRPQTEPDMINLPSRWQLVQAMNKQFWKGWSTDYLQQLQNRTKWRVPCKNLQLNDIVLIKEDNVPPGKWALGRVKELYPGQDGFVRVVSLKTQNTIIKRPVNKLVLLPVHDEVQPKPDIEKTSSPPKQRKHFNAFSMMTVLFYLFTLLSMAYGFETTPTDPNQGLYFDRVANMQLIRNEWKIVIYYDMKPYWEGIAAYEKYAQYLDKICAPIKDITSCDVILEQLDHAFTELEYYNSILNRQNTSSLRQRPKRGLINAIGNIAGDLFGVLDDRFAQQYQKDITLLRNNEKHLYNLFKNQTSIIEAEYNFVKRAEFAIQKQHKMLNRHIVNLERATNLLKTEIERTQYTNQFILAVMSANSMHSFLKNIQDTLIDTVTNIYNGKFNIHLMTPQQLQDELNIISSQVSKDVILPIDNIQTDFQSIYHLLKIKARMTAEYMLFEIRIPLVSRDSYELYKIISIPQQVQNDMILIIPISDYVGMNIQKDSYLPVTADDLGQCLMHESENYMCYLRNPIYALKTDKDLCMKNKNKCQTSKAACENKWINLNKINTYLYFCCDTCHLRAICADQVTSYSLARTNLVSISDDCVIKADKFTIYSHKLFENRFELRKHVGRLEIPPINTILNFTLEQSPLNSTESEEKFENPELKEIGDRINKLKEESILSDQISYHDIHHYTIIYVLLAIVVAAGIGITCRCIRRRRQWTRGTAEQLAPAPTPRSQPQGASVERLDIPIPSPVQLPSVQFKIPIDSTP